MGSEAPVVVYDASVLFPFQTAHLLTFMALRRLVRAHWSADIEREWVERSLEKYGALERRSIENRRDRMNDAIPDAKVSGYEHRIQGIAFPDPNDRHVVALALECGASLIVTGDKKHFNERSLTRYGLRRISPDDLLCWRLEDQPDFVVEVTDMARLALTKSRPGWEAYLDMLNKSGLPRFAAMLRRYVPVVRDAEGPDDETNPSGPGCGP
jgi:predicted nucleic acid-binding protein